MKSVYRRRGRRILAISLVLCSVCLLTSSVSHVFAGSREIIEERPGHYAYPHNVVRHAQKMLVEKGYDPGPIDGLWGSRTRAAVVSFQTDANIPVTGELDQRTKSHLFETSSENRNR